MVNLPQNDYDVENTPENYYEDPEIMTDSNPLGVAIVLMAALMLIAGLAYLVGI